MWGIIRVRMRKSTKKIIDFHVRTCILLDQEIMLSEQQIKFRRNVITATDLAAICEEHPWRRPIDVWRSKNGDDRELSPEALERAEAGNIFEAAIAKMHVAKMPGGQKNWRLYQPHETIVHPVHDWCAATPDRYVVHVEDGSRLMPKKLEELALTGKAEHLLECKLVGSLVARHWNVDLNSTEADVDRIPTYVNIQVHWQLFCTGLRKAFVGALIGGTTFRRYLVEYDEELANSLFEVAKNFREKYVLTNTAPPVDGSDAYGDFLKSRFPVETPGKVLENPTAEFIEAVHSYVGTNILLKETEDKKAVLSQQIKMWLQDHEMSQGPWGKVTWKADSRGKLQYKELVESLNVPADVLDKFRGTPARPIRVTLPKTK